MLVSCVVSKCLEQTVGTKQAEQMDRKLKNGLMNKMEHQQRTYSQSAPGVCLRT